MRKRKKQVTAMAAAAVIGAVAVIGYFAFIQRHDLRRSLERASLPEAVEYESVKQNAALPTSEPTTQAPVVAETKTFPEDLSAVAAAKAEVNLAVPFTAQAPFANWELPYKEFCEEASTLMAAKYLKGENIPSPEAADAAMLAIKTFEEKRFGYYEDTTAAETAVILKEYFGIKAVKLIENPTVKQMKEAVAAGKLVIVPAAGRLLGNPYYTPPGPLYHMLVVKGYTADGKFITNDPGTRRGADFLYSPETILNAMHDWRADKQIELGKKVIIVVG